MIHVHVFAGRISSGSQSVSLPFQGLNLASIIDLLKVDRNDIGLIIVNGKPARIADQVDDSSEIYVLPSIEGG